MHKASGEASGLHARFQSGQKGGKAHIYAVHIVRRDIQSDAQKSGMSIRCLWSI